MIIMRCYWPQNSNLILSHMRDRSQDVVEHNLYLNIQQYITKYAYCVLEIKNVIILTRDLTFCLFFSLPHSLDVLWQIKKHVILPRVNWISFISSYTLGNYQEMRPIPDCYFKMMWSRESLLKGHKLEFTMREGKGESTLISIKNHKHDRRKKKVWDGTGTR